MYKSVLQANGTCARVLRDDAVSHMGRYFVPTTDATVWVSNWEEFRAAGGQMCFCEGQTSIELLLPEPFKFSIRFQDQEGASTRIGRIFDAAGIPAKP